LLKDVLNKGTGAGVRARGFTLPAAGKTGTSRDGWFAGFTSNLVCVIWVGFDDNRDLGLPGGAAAAPIWADFMIRATSLPVYRDVKDFDPPEGVVTVTIDPETLQLATPQCPVTREEVYVTGTAPTEFCERHGGGHMVTSLPPASWLSHIFGGQPKNPPAAGAQAGDPQKPGNPPLAPGATAQTGANGKPGTQQATQPDAQAPDKKKGPLQKFFGIFGGKKKDKDKDTDKPKQDKGDSP